MNLEKRSKNSILTYHFTTYLPYTHDYELLQTLKQFIKLDAGVTSTSLTSDKVRKNGFTLKKLPIVVNFRPPGHHLFTVNRTSKFGNA